MTKKRKKSVNKWLKEIKSRVVLHSSKMQPYQPSFMPWALKNRKKFYCKHDSPCFKNQGGQGLFLLERARYAYDNGIYEQL